MKTYYKLVVSDPIDQPVKNLPFTLQRNFRSFQSVVKFAKASHKKKCSVLIVELNNDGMLNTWEVKGNCVFPESFIYLKEGKQYTKA